MGGCVQRGGSGDLPWKIANFILEIFDRLEMFLYDLRSIYERMRPNISYERSSDIGEETNQANLCDLPLV